MILMKQTDVYRVNDEDAAIRLIEDAKSRQIELGYSLTKSGYVLKTKKQKGEIVDSWAVVTIEKTMDT